MSLAQPALRTTSLRPDRGIISIIEGGASEAAGAGRGGWSCWPTPDPAEPVALTPRNYQTALSLLECAAKALEILYDRRDQLEASLEDVSMRAEGAVVAAQAKVLDWQRLAAGLKSDSQELERRLAAMQQRAELAEPSSRPSAPGPTRPSARPPKRWACPRDCTPRSSRPSAAARRAHKALLVAVDEAPAA